MEHITTFVADVKQRLLAQYKEMPLLRGLIEALLAEVQSVEDALFVLLQQTSLGYPPEANLPTGAVGVWLDRLASIVGTARVIGISDLDDEYFRRLIYARILANKSGGTVEDLIQIATVAKIDTSIAAKVYDDFPAGLVIDLGYNVDTNIAQNAAHEIRRARAAGVGVNVISSQAPSSATFTFSPGPSPVASTTQGFSSDTTGADGGSFANADNA